MKKTLLLLLIFISLLGNATIYQVGTTRNYSSPNALYQANILQDGDTIEIDAGDYSGTVTLAVWRPNNLVIRGVGGRPHLMADGQYIMGKGIWVLAGNNITVENIEFSGAKVPDKNGAGIRLDGTGMTIRNCYFHDNEDGILTSNPYEGDILIEFSEFANNGYGNGFSHNLYIGHIHSLTFRFNYSHHAKVGHALKSRAKNNFIFYNRISDEETGYSSRLIDLPNGGLTVLLGNVLMQGANAINSNMVGYGPEGLTNETPHEIYVINNTFVNKRANCLFVGIKEATSVANLSNNIFAGFGTIYSGELTTLANNIYKPSIAEVHFVDEQNYDYHLLANSPAIDYGTTVAPIYGISLTPDSAYLHPTNFKLRIVENAIDAGAYEFNNVSSSQHFNSKDVMVFPNPTSNFISITNISYPVLFELFTLEGQKIKSTLLSTSTNLSVENLHSGIYIYKIYSRKKMISGKLIRK